jgi:anaerobic dimethyl sulfoxide reductase subunit A
MTQAKEKGIRIVSIDPRYTNSAAAWADQWIPIIPGTDAAMMLAMAYVMIEEDLHDQPFLDCHSIGFERFRDYILGKEDGIAKTPRWAEKISGVSAATIAALAREYATTKPAALQTGYGPQKTARGDQFMRAGMVLAAMTGNIGIPGGSAAGNGAAPALPLGYAFLDEFKLSGYISHMKWAEAILKGGTGGYPSDIKLLYISFSNLLVTFQNTPKGAEALKKPEFIVVHEQFMTPTAKFADILLPVNTCLERNDICRSFTSGGYAIFMPQAIDPLSEARTDLQIFEALADRLGLGKPFNPKTEEEWFDAILDPLAEEERKEFKSEGFYRPKEREKVPYIAFRDQIEDPADHPFPTPSGKIEVFSQRLADFNQPDTIPPIPKYMEPWEGRNDPKAQEYSLQLLTGVSKKRAHSTFDNIPWLQEIESHAMWINPIDAGRRGLKDGQRVLVYNDRGRLTISIKITERIMPGVVGIEGGTWFSPDQDGIDQAGSANVLTKDEPSSVPLFLPYGLPFPAVGSGPTNNSNLVEVKGLNEKD